MAGAGCAPSASGHAMRDKEIKVGAYVAYPHESRGYLKRCSDCRDTIYLWRGFDGKWRPYESWVAGNASEGEWILHRCGGKRPSLTDW